MKFFVSNKCHISDIALLIYRPPTEVRRTAVSIFKNIIIAFNYYNEFNSLQQKVFKSGHSKKTSCTFFLSSFFLFPPLPSLLLSPSRLLFRLFFYEILCCLKEFFLIASRKQITFVSLVVSTKYWSEWKVLWCFGLYNLFFHQVYIVVM